MNNITRLLFKRPIITLFFIYAAYIIFFDAIGLFMPQKQSFLYHFIDYKKPVILVGKVITPPEPVKNGNKIILQISEINDFEADEKVILRIPKVYKASYGDIIAVGGFVKKPNKADFPFVFDYQKYLARNEIYTIFDVIAYEHIESSPNFIKKLAFALQKDIVEKINNYFKKPYADILKPIIIGDKSSIEEEVKNNFIDAGLMHILVASGLNVGFIGAIFLFIFKLSGLSIKKASLLSIPFIVIYVLATGANPPVLRAGIMFSCVLISLALDREPLIYNSLAFSALLILIFQPQQLFTASFQMSYIATLGIVFFYKYVFGLFSSIRNGFIKFLWATFSVTTSAQIVMIPVCMFYFGKISLISFLANVIIVPSIGFILALGIAFYIFTFVFSYISLFIAAVLSVIIHILLFLTSLFADFSFSYFTVHKPSVLSVILFFIFTLSAFTFKGKKVYLIMGSILLINTLITAVPALYKKNKIFFSVYSGKNITVLEMKRDSVYDFLLYQHDNYYDRYFINSFKQYMHFADIKNANITAVGFNNNKLNEDIGSFSAYEKNDNFEYLDFNFEKYKILLDIKNRGLYLNGIFISGLNNNPRFYYDIKKEKMIILPSRQNN